MSGRFEIIVRIDTTPVAGRNGKLYLVLERDEPSTVELRWIGQGRLASGTVRSGERALLFSGTLPRGPIVERWRAELRTPDEWLKSSRSLQFHFEFDED